MLGTKLGAIEGMLLGKWLANEEGVELGKAECIWIGENVGT